MESKLIKPENMTNVHKITTTSNPPVQNPIQLSKQAQVNAGASVADAYKYASKD